MAIRFDQNRIYLNINDLLRPQQHPRFLTSFPLHKRGALGQKAHLRIQAARNKSYGMFHKEYFIRRIFEYDGFEFTVQGRIDGLLKIGNRLEVEEIKSVLLNAQAFRQLIITDYPAYTEQLLFYAYFLNMEFPEAEIKAYLLLINLVNEKERVFQVDYIQQKIEDLINERLNEIIEQKLTFDRIMDRRRRRVSYIDFSVDEKRQQQLEMMDRVANCLEDGMHLMASAPTGAGKTIAALFPAVRYAFIHNMKIFFTTPKTTQQNIAISTLKMLVNRGLELKAIQLRAARKMCANSVFFCQEDYCPYVKDYRRRFYDSGIENDLLTRDILLPDDIIFESNQYLLCPFEVSLDMANRMDVVIGDYNYVFDPMVRLRRLFAKKDYPEWILVLDEAHNLYDRGIVYLSPVLRRSELINLKKEYIRRKNKVFVDLVGSLKMLDSIFQGYQLEGENLIPENRFLRTDLDKDKWSEVFVKFEAAYIRYLIYKIKKNKILPEDPLEQFYYSLKWFFNIMQYEDDAFKSFYDAAEGGILKIQCCDPSSTLHEIIERFHSVLGMSATLEPMDYFQQVLGFPKERTQNLKLDSPFRAKNRKCIIIPNISTRFKDRILSFSKIADIIRDIIAIKKGNYLVFFPSYDYLKQVYLFIGNVGCEILIQNQNMTESERDQYLEKLRDSSRPILLLGVTGGIFSEGVDYPGEMASGVIAISPSLPGLSYERELIKKHFDSISGQGMEYAYIYPGMNKVIQAAGRLIRTSTDRGIIILIGDRFAEDRFIDLLPAHWFSNPGDVVITEKYKSEVEEFWQREH
jgi:DNA excision repair protein ERCC-2